MCAIVGVVGSIPEKKELEKARDLMAHRGPDGAGLYYNEEEGVAFGHRRLSIIDLSDAGKQPFFSNDGRFVLTFNGEIYNYLELKRELKDSYDFKTSSDTEVLLASYIVWGEKALSKLNGMFAFAIWDNKKRELFIARDRFGVKPLYYLLEKETFYFASEIKALLSFNILERKLNTKALTSYLFFRYAVGEETLFKSIKTLLPGTCAYVQEGKPMRIKKYWSLSVVLDKKDPGEKEAVKETTRLLEKSVEYRMRSDVPYGAYLSGGLDSSVIVGMMSQLSKKPVETFAAGFHEEGFNELPYARQVSKIFNTNHHEIILNQNTYFDVLPDVIGHKDAPLLTPNEVHWYLLSQLMKKDITVVLAGSGADELFGGYGKIFRSGYDLERMLLLEEDSTFLPPREKGILLENFKALYGSALYKKPEDHLLRQYAYFSPSFAGELLNQDIFGTEMDAILHRGFFADFFTPLKGLPFSDQYLYFFQNIHLLGTILHLDNVTMSFGIEGREPYLDHALVEYVSALPLKYKLRWKSEEDEKRGKILSSTQISEVYDTSKYLLKKIGETFLPKELIERKKLGFPVPIDSWILGKSKQFAYDTLLSEGSLSRSLFKKEILADFIEDPSRFVSRNQGLHVWLLLNIELWLQKYKVSI
jgi:asparagine synthase (glutamine-hydrolysing)